MASPVDLSTQRWTVDTREDFELVRRLFDAQLPAKPYFTLADLLATMQAHPDWLAINQHIMQKSVTTFQTSYESTP